MWKSWRMHRGPLAWSEWSRGSFTPSSTARTEEEINRGGPFLVSEIDLDRRLLKGRHVDVLPDHNDVPPPPDYQEI